MLVLITSNHGAGINKFRSVIIVNFLYRITRSGKTAKLSVQRLVHCIVYCSYFSFKEIIVVLQCDRK